MKKANILTNVPFEVVEKLSNVLRDIQDYNGLESLSDVYHSDLEGSSVFLALSVLADSMYLIKAKEKSEQL